jgi:branched-chain amino acid transport system ATP-binding protein
MLLEFDGVEAYYGYAKILHGMTFNVDRAEKVALLGRNGVGKTTVVNTICGIADRRGGQLTLNGRPLTAPKTYDPVRNGISIVPQGRRIVPTLTVDENLLVGRAMGRAGHWNISRVYDLFPILAEKKHKPGTSLSGGQQQMLAIGRALVSNPDLLILDEPSEGLAPVVVDELAVLFNRLAAEGTGILLIEQHIGLVRKVATRCYIMSKGSVAESGLLSRWSKSELQKHIVV